jgi:hypothetical protein
MGSISADISCENNQMLKKYPIIVVMDVMAIV